MIELSRRSALEALLASVIGSRPSIRDAGVVNVADFRRIGRDDEDAFRAALSVGSTVIVPSGSYTFSSGVPVDIPRGRMLIGDGQVSICKQGSHLQPLFRAESVGNVVLDGLELRGASRLEQRIDLRPGQRSWPLPWPLGTPPALAVMLISADSSLPLQPEFDFAIRGDTLEVLPKVSMRDVTAALMWREPALCPLVEFSETTDSSMLNLKCVDGALWIRGSQVSPSRALVKGCTLSNGQIRVWGQDNEINPLRLNRRRNETPQGPRTVRIEGNRLKGRIAEGAVKHYLRFGERAAGIEIQSSASDITIVDNDIRSQAGDGIWLASCSDSVVSGNHVEGNGLSGIGLESGVVRESQRCLIRENTVLNNWFDGCDLNFGSGPSVGDLSVVDNIFSGNGFDMKPVSGGCGIFINRVQQARISGNVCENNNLAGILSVRSDMIRLQQNRCLDNGRSSRGGFGTGVGVGINNSTNVSVIENVCGGGRQKAGIAFASAEDLQRTEVSGNTTPDGRPLALDLWNEGSYQRVMPPT